MAGALAGIAELLPAARIDRVWLFPPRMVGGRESGLAVLSAQPENNADDRREVYTLVYEIVGDGGAARREDILEEQATAPAELLDRVIAGVLRRLGTEQAAPELRDIGGDPARWQALLA